MKKKAVKKPSKEKPAKLTPKQERFCQEYIIDLNGTQAAIRAGYSEKTAASQSERMLRKVEIQNFLKGLQNKLSDVLEIKAEDIGRELKKLADCNIQDYLDEGNTIKDISQIPREHAASVQSIKTIETIVGSGKTAQRRVVTEIKLHDKVRCNELLGKHVGFFEKDNSQKSPVIRVSMKKKNE